MTKKYHQLRSQYSETERAALYSLLLAARLDDNKAFPNTNVVSNYQVSTAFNRHYSPM